MKKFLEDFKKFALKGNMIDLAVGMIIGSAFTSIVSSLVNDIFMPVLSIFTGKIDFSNMFIALDGNKYPTLAAANEVTATINYGDGFCCIYGYQRDQQTGKNWKSSGSTKGTYRERVSLLQEHDPN